MARILVIDDAADLTMVLRMQLERAGHEVITAENGRRGLRIFQAVLKDTSGMIEVAWPGQPFLDRSIQKGDTLLVTGSVRFFHGRQLQPREFINLGEDEDAGDTAQGRVLSVYPATEGLSFKVIRSIIDQHLDGLLALVQEYLPRRVLAGADVPLIGDAPSRQCLGTKIVVGYDSLQVTDADYRRSRSKVGLSFVRRSASRMVRNRLRFVAKDSSLFERLGRQIRMGTTAIALTARIAIVAIS